MAAHRFTTVAKLPFVGGSPCLDFVNTTGQRGGAAPCERLWSYADLLVFGRRRGLVDRARVERLARLASERPEQAARALGRMVGLRETLYRALSAAARGVAPEPADLERIGSQHAEASRCRRLVWQGRAATWESEIPRDDLLVLCGPLVRSAVELLTSPDLARVRRCGECDWLFLDTSRNGSRRWCKKACGDRVKSRAYYERRKKNKKV